MNLPNEKQIRLWYSRLFRSALRMTGSIEDAFELTQETFFKALSAWEQFDGRSSPTTWLHSILVNCVRDRSRRSILRKWWGLDAWVLNIVAQRQDRRMREKLEVEDKLARLRHEVEKLPGVLRHAFVAVVLDGYTYQEAAELLSAPVGTIASRISEARRRLRLMMRTWPPQE